MNEGYFQICFGVNGTPPGCQQLTSRNPHIQPRLIPSTREKIEQNNKRHNLKHIDLNKCCNPDRKLGEDGGSVLQNNTIVLSTWGHIMWSLEEFRRFCTTLFVYITRNILYYRYILIINIRA